MRVITGTARGRRLREPKGQDIRPTADQVKEALFNIIQFDVEGRRVLDLFAGTGQLGIEALSRGAREVVFVDREQAAIKLVRENVKLCGFEAKVVEGDAISLLPRLGKFDILLLDPPYDTNLLEKALEIAQYVDILNPSGIIVCECRREKELPPVEAPYYSALERSYGKIKLCVYKRDAGL